MAKGEGKGQGIVGCLICVSLIFGGIVSLIALVGLFWAIYHLWDIFSNNDELMDLAKLALDDSRLEDAYYMFLAFAILAQILACIGGRNKQTGEEDEGGSTQSSCCGTILSLILIGGHMASGILGVLYKDESLPHLRDGMTDMVKNQSYMTTAGERPVYTDMGKNYNFLQVKYDCCGALPNAADYIAANFTSKYQMKFPYACCVLNEKKNTDWRNVNRTDVLNWNDCQGFKEGYFHLNVCYEKERDWLTDKANFIIGYNFCLLALSLGSFALLLAIVICARCCG